MSKRYLVEVTMSGMQWVEADNESEAIEKAEDDPFSILQFTGSVDFAGVLEVEELEE